MQKPSTQNRVLAIRLSLPEADEIEAVSETISDTLIQFSPRLTHRVTESHTWFFLDIGTNHSWIIKKFQTEEHMISALAEKLAHSSLGVNNLSTKFGIADTAPAAQALADAYAFWISKPGHAKADLYRLPVRYLSQLEGLVPWKHPTQIDSIISFLSLLGIKTIDDLSALTQESFQERWGKTGDLVYRRIKAQPELEAQPISPYVPNEKIKFFTHLDFPISILSLLHHETEYILKNLFSRLEGRRLLARRLTLRLRCEWGFSAFKKNHEHIFLIEPSKANRDLSLFLSLIERRLESVDLLNPIQDIEIEIEPISENENQETLFPGSTNQIAARSYKTEVLINLLKQGGAQVGFAKTQDEIWPEKTWSLSPTAASTATTTSAAPASTQNTSTSAPPLALAPSPAPDALPCTPPDSAAALSYGEKVNSAPRPALLRTTPRPLSQSEVAKLHFFSKRPVERLESDWWQDGNAQEKRDYYIVKGELGQTLWVYQEHSRQFYLHGAFD